MARVDGVHLERFLDVDINDSEQFGSDRGSWRIRCLAGENMDLRTAYGESADPDRDGARHFQKQAGGR